MDLSTIDGLSDEQRVKIAALYDTDVAGLKAKNDELLGEKKTISQSVLEKDQILEEARKVAKQAEIKNLELQGKYDEAQVLQETERAKLVAEAESNAEMYKTTLEKYHTTKLKDAILANVTDLQKPFVEAMLDKSISTEMKDNEMIATLSHGDNKFTTAQDFINGVGEDKAWQSVLKGVDSSGAGTTQSGKTTTGTDPDAAYKQRLRDAGLTT